MRLLHLRLVPAALLWVAATVGHAASPAASHGSYAQDRAACASITAPDSRAACVREAGAAQQAARTGHLSSGGASTYERNAIQRCAVFRTPSDQADCVSRVQSDTTSGSVTGGGVLREAETPVTPR